MLKATATKYKTYSKGILFFCCLVMYVNTLTGQLDWYAQSSGLTAETIYDVCFLNTSKGFGVAANGKILKTEDGGQTWYQITSPVSVNLRSVSFSSPSVGWIVGESQTLLKSIDEGNTWSIVVPPAGSGYDFYGVQFVDENHGWFFGGLDFYRTLDGGNGWIDIDPSGAGGSLLDVHFINKNEGWIVGVGNYVAYSTDGGGNWTAVSFPGTSEPTAVYASSINHVVVTTSDGIVRVSDNGGVSWIEVLNLTTGYFLDLDFLNDQMGVAVGAYGTAYITQDGGYSWVDNNFCSYSLFSVDMVENGQGWVSGDAGSIYKSEFQDNDISIYAYHGIDKVCKDVKTDVVLTLYNAGPAPIEDADIVLTDGSDPFHYYHWSGFLAGGSYVDVNIGLASVSTTGTYYGVIAGDSIDANNISTKYIEVVPNPAYTSGPHNICLGDSVEIYAGGGVSLEWLSNVADPFSPYQVVKPIQHAKYFVQIVADYCTVLDSVEIFVSDCSEPITAITPNGDGKNDFLYIPSMVDTDNELNIYNRWGDLVNSFSNYDNNTVIWDGTGFGNVWLPEGVYYYTFRHTDNSRNLSSWVQVLR